MMLALVIGGSGAVTGAGDGVAGCVVDGCGADGGTGAGSVGAAGTDGAGAAAPGMAPTPKYSASAAATTKQ